MGNSTAANVLATIGTVCWCVQLIPQIIHNWRRKDTEGLPAAMMFIWAASALPFGIYFLLLDESIPLQIQPQLFGFFSTVAWAQCLYYRHNYSRLKAFCAMLILCVAMGGLEVLFVLTLRIPQHRGITWPRLIFGIIATILFAVGFIPIYLELWRTHGRVIGIDFIFLSIDMSGAIFSLISLPVGGQIDVLGIILYLIILVCELGIVVSHCLWCLCHWDVVKEARRTKRSVDEIMDERQAAARVEEGHEAEVDEEKDHDPSINDGTLANDTDVETNEQIKRETED